MRSIIIAAACCGALALPAAAAAHVTLQPSEATAGDFTRFEVRVPNERDNAGTTKVEVQFPPGFLSASYEPVPGWEAEVEMRDLDQPAELHGEEVTEEVDTVTWTADGDTAVQPGQFQDFGISVQVPEAAAGKPLTFKALQTYEGGEVVRWIGPEGSDEPAPVVQVAAASDTEPAADTGVQAAAEGSGDEKDDDSSTLALIALIVGGLGLLAGLGALLSARRRTA